MGKWGKLLVAAAAPLLLTACLWTPGKFVSELTLRKNGSYTLDYKGEILLQLPESQREMTAKPWRDDMARCFAGGRSEMADLVSSDERGEARACGAEELARLKADHDRKENERVASKRQESDQMSKAFGLPGSDDGSNRKFAASMMKYKGWRSVVYQGNGKFLVDYHTDGSLTQDVVFPMIPDSDVILPFIAMRRRADGAVLVTAPAYTGRSGPFGARAAMMGMTDKDDGPKSHAQGRFTIVTNGEILTNNSEDGAAPHAGGRQLKWDVDAASTKLPEALVKL